MRNVAAQYPEKLAEMKKLWWTEAASNGDLPQLEAPQGFIGRASRDQRTGWICADDGEEWPEAGGGW